MAAKQGSSPKVKNAGKKKRIVADPKPVHRTGGRKPQEQLITSWKRVQGIQNRVFTLTKEMLEARLGEEIRLDVELHLKFLCGMTTEPFLDEEPLLRHPELEQPTAPARLRPRPPRRRRALRRRTLQQPPQSQWRLSCVPVPQGGYGGRGRGRRMKGGGREGG